MAYASQFCQHTERSLRCVAQNGHAGKHDLQPISAASVRAIERQELADTRLSRGHVTPEQLVEALDKATPEDGENDSRSDVPVP